MSELTPEMLDFIDGTVADIRERLVVALPRMAQAVSDSGKQATFSPTVTLKAGKKNRLKATIAARVRMPDQERDVWLTFNADGQLVLSFDPATEVEAPVPPPPMPGEQDLPMETNPTPAPVLSGPMSPAQKRKAEIRAQNIELARAGKLTAQQIKQAGITDEEISGLPAMNLSAAESAGMEALAGA